MGFPGRDRMGFWERGPIGLVQSGEVEERGQEQRWVTSSPSSLKIGQEQRWVTSSPSSLKIEQVKQDTLHSITSFTETTSAALVMLI